MGTILRKMNKETRTLVFHAKDILAEYKNPMTIRQIYYQLVARGFIDNNKEMYAKVSRVLVIGRKNETIPWNMIEDRTRKPKTVSMWKGLDDFGDDALRSYRQDVWATQPKYVEVWVEKDALSGIFGDILRPYGVTLNVGKGFDGWTSIKDAAARFIRSGKPVSMLYFGDFDPSGEDMNRSLEERLNFFNSAKFGSFELEMPKVAILKEDIKKYKLPPAPVKNGDPRAAQFVETNGSTDTVELDALPIDVLKDRIKSEIEDRLDMAAFAKVRSQEEEDKNALEDMLEEFAESR